MKINNSKYICEAGYYLYDGSNVSEANFLTSKTDSVTKETFTSYTFSTTLNMRSDILYLCYYVKKTSGESGRMYCYWTDVWLELTYPDTTNLYL